MLDIAIVDDQKHVQDCMRDALCEFGRRSGNVYNIHAFDSGKNLIYEMDESRYRPSVLFLDVEMPGMNGVETAKMIRAYDKTAHLIFVTSHDGFAKDTIEYSPFRYINKMELPDKLFQALEALQEKMEWEDKSKDYYIVEDSKYPERIRTGDILYIEKDGKNSVIVKKSGRMENGVLQERSVSKTRKALETVYEELDPEQFAFVDRKTIVNLNHVMGLGEEEILLRDGTKLFVCSSRMKELKEKLRNLWA